MKPLYQLKPGDRFTVPALPNIGELTFERLDGMYSITRTDDGQVCHLGACTEVEPCETT